MSSLRKVIGSITKPVNPGEFEWLINDCSKEILQTDCYLESPTFSFSDCSWSLRMYPKGLHVRSDNWISLFLMKKNSQCENNITFCLRLAFQDMQLVHVQDIYNYHTFKKYRNTWGWNFYIPREVLNHRFMETKGYGKLSIQITFMNYVPSEADIKRDIEALPKDFKDLVLHKLPDRNLFSPFKLPFPSGGVVEIPNQFSAFEQFLVKVITGSREKPNKDIILGFYELADRWCMEYLKELCSESMKKSLSPHNVCDIIRLASNYTDLSLLEMAEIYFVENAKEVLVTAEWQSFIKENPTHANELFTKAANYYKSKKKNRGINSKL